LQLIGVSFRGGRARKVAPKKEETMGTTLAFRTPPGAVSIPVGASKTLGIVDVHHFERIRVVADERVGSAGPVVIV
jgi:hypothetical protein